MRRFVWIATRKRMEPVLAFIRKDVPKATRTVQFGIGGSVEVMADQVGEP